MKTLILIIMSIFVSSCISQDGFGPSEENFKQAEEIKSTYIVTKSEFFGYSLYNEYLGFSGSKGIQDQVLSSVVWYKESPKSGPFDTVHVATYKDKNRIIQLNFTKEFSSDYEVTAFYHAALREMAKNYPRDVVKKQNSNLHFIECTSSAKKWIETYAWYLNGTEFKPYCIHNSIHEIILSRTNNIVSLVYSTNEIALEYQLKKYRNQKGMHGI